LVIGLCDLIPFFGQVLTTKDGKTAVKHLSTLKNHASSVNAIRFSPYGDLLASAGDAGELLLWKPRGGEALVAAAPSFGADEEEEGSWKYSTTLRGHSSDIYDLAWSPDATALLSGSVENIALLWDVKSGKGKARLQDHKHFIQVGGASWP
jgi:chromatin assembly factor 1 subunit B